MHKLLSVVVLLASSSAVYANPFTKIPEPEMLPLLGLGVVSLLIATRRRKK